MLPLNDGMYFGFLNEHIGTQALMMPYFDDYEFIHEINDLQCTLCERAPNKTIDKIKLNFIEYYENMAYRNGSMVSIEMFCEFMPLYYRRIGKIVNTSGIDIQMLDYDDSIREPTQCGRGIWYQHFVSILRRVVNSA